MFLQTQLMSACLKNIPTSTDSSTKADFDHINGVVIFRARSQFYVKCRSVRNRILKKGLGCVLNTKVYAVKLSTGVSSEIIDIFTVEGVLTQKPDNSFCAGSHFTVEGVLTQKPDNSFCAGSHLRHSLIKTTLVSSSHNFQNSIL